MSMNRKKIGGNNSVLMNPSTPPSSVSNSSNDLSYKKKNKKRKRQKDTSSQGRWTDEEHQKFVEGLNQCGKNWKKLESFVPTRNSTQIRSHAQKFFIRIERQYNTKNPLEYIRNLKSGSTSNCSNSVVSGQESKPCECEIHNKIGAQYGTHLHPNDLPNSQTNNYPCSCRCSRCKFITRSCLDNSKMKKIKKRIRKACERINEHDSDEDQPSSSSAANGNTACTTVAYPDLDHNLPDFMNLFSLGLILQKLQGSSQDDDSR